MTRSITCFQREVVALVGFKVPSGYPDNEIMLHYVMLGSTGIPTGLEINSDWIRVMKHFMRLPHINVTFFVP